MDQTFRIEPRRIEFTTYGPARAPVWIVTFALHTASGYEHQCTVIVPGLGHDDVTDIHTKARAELFRLGGMIAGSANPVDEADTHAPHTSNTSEVT
ncbi:hypothetical protein M2440_001364 [Methylorubrum extorquens]|nr:hypothetical protein [Methylorubrum extorquens]